MSEINEKSGHLRNKKVENYTKEKGEIREHPIIGKIVYNDPKKPFIKLYNYFFRKQRHGLSGHKRYTKSL